MKVTFVYSQIESHWLSCQTITKNLLASYSQIFPIENSKKCQIVNYNKDSRLFDIEKISNNIFEFNPDIIVFLDHSPHPYPVLKAYDLLLKQNKQTQLPVIHFHVYGDFPLMSKEWIQSAKILKKFAIKWICASDSQTELIRKFIKKGKDSIFKIPFPVDTSSYFFDSRLRSKARTKLGITKNEVVFVYSGRISYQKRIQDLLDLFGLLVNNTDVSIRLFILGPFDSLGNPYTGEYFQEGEFAQKLINYFNTFTEDVKSKITYLGCAEETMLNEVYNAADIFVSLSTHNDEDYGMAPAEAICTGLPAILSDWGGYSSFAQNENQVLLIPTRINANKPLIEISRKEFGIKAAKLISQIESLRTERDHIKKKNLENFGVDGVASQLKKLIKTNVEIFSGFTPAMEDFGQSLKKSAPFLEGNPKYSDFYNELYESYVSKKL